MHVAEYSSVPSIAVGTLVFMFEQCYSSCFSSLLSTVENTGLCFFYQNLWHRALSCFLAEVSTALGWSGRPSGNYQWLISCEPMMWGGQMEERSTSLLPALQALPVQCLIHVKVPASFQEDWERVRNSPQLLSFLRCFFSQLCSQRYQW